MQKQQDDGAKVFAELASTADAHLLIDEASARVIGSSQSLLK
jgi:hypothetical protein